MALPRLPYGGTDSGVFDEPLGAENGRKTNQALKGGRLEILPGRERGRRLARAVGTRCLLDEANRRPVDSGREIGRAGRSERPGARRAKLPAESPTPRLRRNHHQQTKTISFRPAPGFVKGRWLR